MSDNLDEIEETDEGGLKALRAKASAAEKAEKENTRLRRELAMSKAGIPDTPIGNLFRQSWDGDLDPAAVKAAWEELGIAHIEPDPSGDAAAAAVADAAASAAGAPPPGTAPKPVPEVANDLHHKYRDDRNRHVDKETADRRFIQGMLRAAADPDPGVNEQFRLVSIPGRGEMTVREAKALGLSVPA